MCRGQGKSFGIIRRRKPRPDRFRTPDGLTLTFAARFGPYTPASLMKLTLASLASHGLYTPENLKALTIASAASHRLYAPEHLKGLTLALVVSYTLSAFVR